MTRTIVLTSGGFDSAAVLRFAIDEGADVLALFVDYGQRSLAAERDAVDKITSMFNVPLAAVYATTAPRSVYEAEGRNGKPNLPLPPGMPVKAGGYVPGRNLLFISTAAALAEASGYDRVYYGATAASRDERRRRKEPVYGDTSAAFLQAARRAVAHSSSKKVLLNAPFVFATKLQIRDWYRRKFGRRELDRLLSMFVSCYAVGSCDGSCKGCKGARIVRRR